MASRQSAFSRLERFQSAVEEEGLDGFLCLHPQNRNYLSGFTGSSGALILGEKKALFLTDSRYTQQAKSQVKGAEIKLQTQALLKDAVSLVKKLKIKRLGFESVYLPHAAWAYLGKELKGVELRPTRQLAEKLRLVKDEGEKARMRQAARVTDQTFHHIVGRIRSGVKENAIAGEMEAFMRARGASAPSFETIVASGWRSALPHGVASPKKIEKGDLVVLDFGCVLDGYCSDMTRTVCVGPPSPFQRRIYGIVRKAQAAGLKKIKAGVACGEVDKASRTIINRAGYGRKFGHGLGHGVGVEVHEDPRLGPSSKEKLEEGVAVTVEPGIYLEGKFGVRIEDLVLVTKTGHENLYRSTKSLISVKAH